MRGPWGPQTNILDFGRVVLHPQEESRKPPSTKFSEKDLITNVTQGKLSNKKFSIAKIHKKHIKSVTQL
jgi:hypothetical protein